MLEMVRLGTRASLTHLLIVDVTNRGRNLAEPTPSADPDAPVVARLIAGDETALGELMKRHGGRLRQIALRMTGRSDDAEDIVQDAFVAVWRRAGALKVDGAPFGAYLTRTVVNRCIDKARREKLRRMIGLDSTPEPEDQTPGADQAVASRSEMAAVAQDLRALPARQRAAILLVSTQEHGVGEVAQIMGLSVGAVEQLLVRARRTLRNRAFERMNSKEEATGA